MPIQNRLCTPFYAVVCDDWVGNTYRMYCSWHSSSEHPARWIQWAHAYAHQTRNPLPMGARRPVMTWALIAACTAVWLVEVLLGFLSPTLQNWLIYRGMLAPATMLAEPWAIVTSMFLHAPNSILHILFNMIALYSVGPVLERLIGHWRFLGLYMISGLGGALGMMVWAVVAPGGQGWQTAAYGASGALFGLFAASGRISVRC